MAKAVGGVLIAVLGLGALFGFLIPDIDLGIKLPDIEVPDWAEIALDSLKYLIAVVIAIALACASTGAAGGRELRANEAARIAAESRSATDHTGPRPGTG